MNLFQSRPSIATAAALSIVLATQAATPSHASFSTAPTFIDCGLDPFGVAAGDLNGDGIADIVVAAEGPDAGGTVRSKVVVFLGSGGGSFAPYTMYDTASQPQAIAIADFNQDGFPDLADVDRGGDQLSVRFGAGDGTFGQGTGWSLGGAIGVQSIAIGDLNADGYPDVVAGGLYNNNKVVTLINDRAGRFPSTTVYTFADGSNPMKVQAADMDGDGYADVETSHRILYNDGHGGLFTSPPSFNWVQLTGTDLHVTDLDHDGLQDIVAVAINQVAWSLYGSTGHSAVTGSCVLSTYVPRKFNGGVFALADADHDGFADLELVGNNEELGYDGKLRVWRGLAEGQFAGPIDSVSIGLIRGIVAADINGDGREDLLFAAKFLPIPHGVGLIGIVRNTFDALGVTAPPREVSLLATPVPNPSAGTTSLEYTLPRAARAQLRIVDLQGRSVATLVDGAQRAGRHATDWDGRASNGSRVAPGVYLARLVTGGQRFEQRIVRIR